MQSQKDYYSFVNPYLEKYDYDSLEFRHDYHFSGTLGFVYKKNRTVFRVWSPVVKNVEILSYGFWSEDYKIPVEPAAIWPMEYIKQGVWHLKIDTDLHLMIYRLRVTYDNGEQRTCNDPYSIATTVNSSHSVVLDLDRTQPENWNQRRMDFTRSVDAIIYEMSIRDFTIYPETDIEHKGKYLGLTETGRTNRDGLPVGLDYLTSLGITHVQLMPFYDFETVNEEHPSIEYNWGYDPANYNVPDGSFATDPYNPLTRIREVKEMVQALHDKGIRVIMDVVYNHVYDVAAHPFTVLVPGYYFRHTADGKLANGTFCGNEIASERSMVSKYITDSVLYWAREYNLDGFRFDLLGILDVFTVRTIREQLDEIDPSIIMLGEGWNLGDVLPEVLRTTAARSHMFRGIGFFNDQFRNSIRGNVFDKYKKGFAAGGETDSDFLNYALLAERYFRPGQMVQYAAAHDNYTLFDQIASSLPMRSFEEYERRQNLANSMVLLSQGVAFIHSGQEFMRTKFGNPNSYNSPDSVNQIVWSETNRYSVDYFRALVKFRKEHQVFHYRTFNEILKNVQVDFLSDHLIKMRIHSENSHNVDFWVFFNSYEGFSSTLIDAGIYKIYFADNGYFVEEPRILELEEGSNRINISPLSTLVMEKINDYSAPDTDIEVN
ncbi:MAG: type I pullulanase [Clostridiaceae bacterium]|nr:type I pullulanase [Clostridiaceae bacterium]